MAKLNTRKRNADEAPNADAKRAAKLKKIAVRWGDHMPIVQDGFVPIARNFLKYAALLKPFSLTPSEQLFVINLMYHKWDRDRPYPTYATLAARMGKSVQHARDIARSLERKGLLEREVRRGRSNRFDLQPLFDALANHVVEKQSRKTPESEEAEPPV